MKLRWLIPLLLCVAGWAQTTTPGSAGGLNVSCNAVTTATSANPGTSGGCASISMPAPNGQLPGGFTWIVTTTGSPASVTVNFVGSLDNQTWVQLDTSSTSGSIQSVVGKPMRYVGCVPATLSGGSSPTVSCKIAFTTASAGGGGTGGGGISTVNAGTGLTGGGSSSTVTVGLSAPVSPANGGTGTITAPTSTQVPVGQGGGTYTPETVSGDSTITAGGVMSNVGLEGVPFCAGYSPTNGQVPEYTTGGSPNPCYGALTPTGSGTVGSSNQYNGVQYSGAGASTTVGGIAWLTGFDGVPQYMTEITSGGSQVAQVPLPGGVPIDATNPATLLKTDRANYLPWTSGSAQAWPSLASTGFGNNYVFSLKNTSGSALIFTPNAGHSDLCNGSATCTMLNNFMGFIYSDGGTNWYKSDFPTFAAFGATNNGVKWSTTTGFGAQAGSDIATLVQGLTGCNTASYVFTPQASDCVAQTGGGGVASGTQGYPYANTDGSTGNATSAVWVDATLFTGADMCAKIDTARQSSSCASATLGCNIKAPFVGKQVCNTNPFAHWSNGGILQLGGAKNLDIRSSVTWNIPPNTKVIGTGATGAGGSSAVNNVILRAGNAAWQLGATNFAVPHEAISNASGACSGLNTQSSICVSGTTAFVNVSNTLCNATTSPSYGQDVFIYGGPGIFAAFHGFAVNIAANNSNACVAGAATQFELQVPSGTSTCTSSCGTVYEGQPLLNLGLNPPIAAQYRTQLEGLSLDCAWTLGCLPLLNNGSEEDSWFRNVNFMNYGGEAFRLSEYTTAGFLSGGTTGGGASQSGPYSDFSINFLPETCEVTANSGCNTTSTGVGTNNPLYETSGVSTNPQSQNPLGCFTTAIVVDGPRSSGGTTTVNHIDKISSFTISASDPDPANVNNPNTPVAMNDATCGTPYTSHTTPIGILTWGAMVDIENFHIEDYPAEIQVGGNSALNAAYPGTTVGLSTQSTVTTNGVRISNGATSSASTNAWEVDLGANAGDVEVGKMTRFGGTHILKDNVTGNTCTDKTLSAYFLGNGTNPNVLTTCNGLGQQFDGSMTMFGSSSGSVVLSTPSTGGQLNVNGPVNATTGFQIGGAATNNHCLVGNGTNYVDNTCPGGTGTVTSVATTAPITGGTFTTSGTIACATCVVASSPGAGIAHFAGSTQTVTSSAIVAADITNNTITGTQLASSLSLVTPLLGTPTSGVITNLTGTCGSCIASNIPASTTLTTPNIGAATYTSLASSTKCAAAGSAANPSLVACSAAPAGLFSCATNASTGTCVISTTAVTASSVIQIQPDSTLGTALSVTCNTTADTGVTAPRVSARTAATSFTITLGTFSTNPECFSYVIIN